MYTSSLWAPNELKDGEYLSIMARSWNLAFFPMDKGMQELHNATLTLFYQKVVQD